MSLRISEDIRAMDVFQYATRSQSSQELSRRLPINIQEATNFGGMGFSMFSNEVHGPALMRGQASGEFFTDDRRIISINPCGPLFDVVSERYLYQCIGTFLLREHGDWQVHGRHALSHSPRPFPSALNVVQVHHRVHEVRVSRLVHLVNVLCSDWRGKTTRTLYLEPVIKHPNKNVHVPQRSVGAMNTGVDYSFHPCVARIFRSGRRELAVFGESRKLPKLLTNDVVCRRDQNRDRSFGHYVLDHIPFNAGSLDFAFMADVVTAVAATVVSLSES